MSLIKGSTFPDKHSILMASLTLCATVARSHKVKNSDSGRLRIQCPSQECSYVVNAKPDRRANNGLWKVGKLNLTHSCDAIKGKRKRKPLTQTLVEMGGSPVRNLSVQGRKVRYLQEDVAKLARVPVSYSQAYSLKQSMSAGTSAQACARSMMQLPALLTFLKEADKQGSYVSLVAPPEDEGLHFAVEEDQNHVTEAFKCCYCATGAARAFWEQEGTRRVASVDGTHVKTPLGGVLLTCSVKDANSQVIILAFAYVKVENFSTWSFFLKRVIDDFPGVEVLIGDGDNGMAAACREHYSGVTLSRCVRHLIDNYYKSDRSVEKSDVKNLFYALACCCNDEEEVYLRNKLREKVLPVTFEKFLSVAILVIDKYMPPRYGDCTNNVSELENSAILEMRESVPCRMILDLVRKTTNTFCTRALDLRQPQSATAGQLSKWARHKLETLWCDVQNFSCVVQDIKKGHLGGSVTKGTQVWSVRISQLEGERSEVSCKCRKPEKTGLLCVHALTVFDSLRGRHANVPEAAHWNHLDKKWASTVFHHATLQSQYVAAAALASQVDINVDLQMLPIARQMSAWRVPSQAGRPKKRRKQGVAAPQRKSRCSACGQVGHYATTCEAPDAVYLYRKVVRE